MNLFRFILSIFFIVALAVTTFMVVAKAYNTDASISLNPLILKGTPGAKGEISGAEGRDYRPGEVLVQFKPYVTEEEIDRIAKISGLEMMKTVSPPNLFLFRVIGNLSLRDVIKFLKRFEEVEYSGPNHLPKHYE
jgi:hypothetical protein